MSDTGYEAYPDMPSSMMPDFSQFAAQRLAAKPQDHAAATSIPNGGKFDPYVQMVKRNQINKGEVVDDTPSAPTWPEKDIKRLQDYCTEMGIVGVNFKGMNPRIVLQKLQQEFGGNFKDVPVENRVPFGYEKLGKQNPHSSNFPFSSVPAKKTLLNG